MVRRSHSKLSRGSAGAAALRSVTIRRVCTASVAWLAAAALLALVVPPATTTGAPAPVDRCEANALSVNAEPPSAALSHRSIQLSFALKPGAAPCVLAGYPTVDIQRGVSNLIADETPRGYMGGLPAEVDLPPSIALEPGGSARAVVEGPATDSAGNDCPTYTHIRVIPPAAWMEFNFPTSISVCSLEVHPVTTDDANKSR
jgi:Protein of unknown function (DUF4232)